MTTTKVPRPRLTSLAFFGMQLNSSLEKGQHGVSFDDVYDGLDNGTLWQTLAVKAPDMDISLWQSPRDEQGQRIIAALRDAASGMRQRESKYGVERGGLTLLLAYLLEAVQQQYWEIPHGAK